MEYEVVVTHVISGETIRMYIGNDEYEAYECCELLEDTIADAEVVYDEYKESKSDMSWDEYIESHDYPPCFAKYLYYDYPKLIIHSDSPGDTL